VHPAATSPAHAVARLLYKPTSLLLFLHHVNQCAMHRNCPSLPKPLSPPPLLLLLLLLQVITHQPGAAAAAAQQASHLLHTARLASL
jgi:hypothetical protein